MNDVIMLSSNTVRDIGKIYDSNLSFKEQIGFVADSAEEFCS